MDTRTLTTAGVEYRQDDNGVGLVSGPVVNYGDVARTRRGPELVHPGAFLGTTDPALPVNLQHRQQVAERIATVGDGLLTFRDTSTALYADLRLPDTPIGRSAAAGVQAGELRGWSGEFVPLIERAENGVNAVYRGLLVGLGLVDVPAYPGSLVVMNRGGGGRMWYNRDYVRRDRGRQRKEHYKPGAFRRGIENGEDVILYLQNTQRGGVASTRAGSLVLIDGDEALDFEVTEFATTEAGRDFTALAEAQAMDFGVQPLVQVPDYPDAFYDEPEEPGSDVMRRVYTDVILRGLLVTNRKPAGDASGDVALRSKVLAWL